METAFSPSENPAQPPPEPALDLNVLSKEAEEILGTMLRMLSFEATLASTAEKEIIRIRIQCENAGRLIGRRGATVNEIQFLLNRILQRRHKAIPRIYLDVDGSLEKAAEEEEAGVEWIAKIEAAADQVRRWGEPVEVELANETECKAAQERLAKDRELEAVFVQAGRNGTQKIRVQVKSSR